MKRYLSVLLAVFLALMPGIAAFASGAGVYADKVSASSGETVTIPVKIRDNPGLMGFGIIIDYPSDIFIEPEVSRGLLTSDGLFNDSIADGTSGQFNVVWSNTEEIKDDGVLFILRFRVKENIKNPESEITMTCSQVDTFDEKYKDVPLNCSPIKISSGGSTSGSSSEAKNETVQSVSEVSSSFLVDAVDSGLEKFGVLNISALTDDQFDEFRDYLTEEISDYGADINLSGVSKTELKNAYEDASVDVFVESAFSAEDPGEIIDTVDDALAQVGAGSIDEIPDDKEETFLELVSDITECDGVHKLPSDMTDSQKIKAVSELYRKSSDENKSDNEVKTIKAETQKKSDNTKLFIVIAVIIIAALAVFMAIFLIKRRNRIEK